MEYIRKLFRNAEEPKVTRHLGLGNSGSSMLVSGLSEGDTPETIAASLSAVADFLVENPPENADQQKFNRLIDELRGQAEALHPSSKDQES